MSTPLELRGPRPVRAAGHVVSRQPAAAAQWFAEIVSIEVMGTLARLAEMDHE